MGRSLMLKSRLVLGLMLVSAVSPGAVLAASSQATGELEGVVFRSTSTLPCRAMCICWARAMCSS